MDSKHLTACIFSIEHKQPPHRVGQHGAEVGGQRQHGQAVEDHPVDHGEPEAPGGKQHDEGDHEVGEEDQEPGDEGADHAAAVLDEPELPGLVAGTPLHHRRLLVLIPVQQGALLLHVPQTVAGRHFCPDGGNRGRHAGQSDLY